MKHFLLFYELEKDYLERRGEFRDAHLTQAWNASNDGDLMIAGALANPADMSVFLFKGETGEAAEKFAKTDPYVLNGIVKRWYVREWMTVVGESCSAAVYPAGYR